mmetsp:Transcript_13970/g.42609  ORF Transcript_13970/g.42609 Transcript_13970/m.42609 type:complete len:248 (-) Transcript_13970:2149-2892(-)
MPWPVVPRLSAAAHRRSTRAAVGRRDRHLLRAGSLRPPLRRVRQCGRRILRRSARPLRGLPAPGPPGHRRRSIGGAGRVRCRCGRTAAAGAEAPRSAATAWHLPLAAQLPGQVQVGALVLPGRLDAGHRLRRADARRVHPVARLHERVQPGCARPHPAERVPRLHADADGLRRHVAVRAHAASWSGRRFVHHAEQAAPGAARPLGRRAAASRAGAAHRLRHHPGLLHSAAVRVEIALPRAAVRVVCV